MRKIILSLFLCFSFFFLANSSAYADTFTVARDGSGNYNCDGSADQVQINQALQAAAAKPGSTVHLKPGRYVAAGIIYIGGATTLEGESGTILTFADGFRPSAGSNQALIMYQSNLSSSKGSIIIRGFEIDGAYEGSISHACGEGNFMFAESVDGFELYDMYWHKNCNDGIKIKNSKNIKIHDLKIEKLGHDAIVIQGSSNGEVWNNNIKARNNAGIRLFGSSFISIHDNFIYADEGSGPGLELQRGGDKGDNLHDIEVYNNLIYNTCQVGIQLIAYKLNSSPTYTRNEVFNVHIHHNLIIKCGWNSHYDWVAGISVAGVYNVVIENNTFDGNYGGAIVYMESINLQSQGTSGKYDVYVRNNIITNTQKRKGNDGGTPGAGDYSQSGQGIINYSPSEGDLRLENNLVYGNVGGDYKNVSSSSDIHTDPLYADSANGDYHIKSQAGRWDPKAKSWVADSVSSPAIDGGLISSAYTNEPEDNGDRINIGRYGNTTQASLTGNSKQNPMPLAPADDSFIGLDGSTSSGGSSSGGGTSTPAPYVYQYYSGAAFASLGSPTMIEIASAIPADEVEDLFPAPEEGVPDSNTCTNIAGSAGFIPCGRGTNDPDTEWNECAPCNICSAMLVIQIVTSFLVKVAAVAATLSLIVAGFLYIFAAGKTQLISKSKSMIKYTLIGFIIIFVAWLSVDTLFTVFGYIDPLEGKWYIVC